MKLILSPSHSLVHFFVFRVKKEGIYNAFYRKLMSHRVQNMTTLSLKWKLYMWRKTIKFSLKVTCVLCLASTRAQASYILNNCSETLTRSGILLSVHILCQRRKKRKIIKFHSHTHTHINSHQRKINKTSQSTCLIQLFFPFSHIKVQSLVACVCCMDFM